jgi:hypothetical protein
MSLDMGECPLSARDDYRQNVLECLRWAQTAANPRDKAMFVQMAKTWAKLADQAATIGSLAELAAMPATAVG